MSNKAARSVPGTKAVLCVCCHYQRELSRGTVFQAENQWKDVLKAERAPQAKAPGHSIPGNASQDSSEHLRTEARGVGKARSTCFFLPRKK